MSSKRKSPPTKLSEGGGGVGTIGGTDEEEEASNAVQTGGGESGQEESAGPLTLHLHHHQEGIENCGYNPLQRGDCESSGCSSPATPSEHDPRDSPSPTPNSPPAAKRQRMVFLPGQEAALAYSHLHHQAGAPAGHGATLEPASSSECGSPPAPLLAAEAYYGHHHHHQSHPHHNNNNTVTQNNNNHNGNGNVAPGPGGKRSMDDVLKRLTCKMNSGSLSLQDDATRRTPPPSSTPNPHVTHNSHRLVKHLIF